MQSVLPTYKFVHTQGFIRTTYSQLACAIGLSNTVYKVSRITILSLLLLTELSQTLLAQNPLAPASKFNVFLAADAKLTTNESEGAVALAGNLTVAGNYQVAVKNGATAFTVNNYPIGLVVGKGVKLQQGTLQLNSGTYAKIGECAGNAVADPLKVWYQDNNRAYSTIRITKSNADYSATPMILINQNANASTETNTPICQGNVVDFAGSFSTLKSNASALAQAASRVKLTDPNGQTISSTNLPSQVKIGLYAGINVWNVTGEDLNRIQNLTYTDAPSAAQVLVINVKAAGSFTWKTPSLGGVGGNNAPYILWNFYNTTDLAIEGNSTIEGSVLAPFANVVKTVNQSNIEGQLVANAYTQSGGEMHHFPFDADLKSLFTPDLTPIIYARSSTVYNTSPITVVVDILEVLNVPTSGLVTVKVSKQDMVTLNFSAGITKLDNRSVQNSQWTFDGDSDPDYYILKTTAVIDASDQLSFGFTGTLTPGATSGTMTFSTMIVGGSGGEVRINNNMDADKIDYFQQ